MKMQRFIETAFALTLAALLAASCEKFRDTENVTDTRGRGELAVKLSLPQGGVLPTRGETPTDGELTTNDVAVLVYDYSTSSSGALEAYQVSSVSQDLSSAPTFTFTLKPGTKIIEVVVNPPSGFKCSSLPTMDDFDSHVYSIDNDCSSSELSLQMEGYESCVIKQGKSRYCEIAVRRICARVALAGVTNSSGKSLTLQRAFLTNVSKSYSTTGGDGTPEGGSYNPQGRLYSTSSSIIDSPSDADVSLLTYKDLGRTLSDGSTYSPSGSYFYCYQNESTAVPSGWEYGKSYNECTALVVVASLDGTTYYYPVVLDPSEMGSGATYGVERNKAYTVSLTITGPGSDDPNKPVTGASATSSIRISDWSTGGSIDKSFE